MIITMLNRLSNDKKVKFTGTFNDVEGDKWYSNAIYWGEKHGIISGYDDKSFKPNAKLSREQFVTILYRYAKYKKYNLDSNQDLSMYKDHNELPAYAVTPMKWAIKNGIIKGLSKDTISGKTGATRAQMATVFERFIKSFAN